MDMLEAFEVKQEPVECPESAAADIEELYVDHQVKEELVIGPTLLLRTDIRSAEAIKPEPDCDNDTRVAEGSLQEIKREVEPVDRDDDTRGAEGRFQEIKREVVSVPCSSHKPLVAERLKFEEDDFVSTTESDENNKENNFSLSNRNGQSIKPIKRNKVGKGKSNNKYSIKKLRTKSHNITSPLPTNYICDYCQKCFGTRTQIHSHVKYHMLAKTTDKEKFHCHICSKSFSWLNNLKRHINDYHNNKTIFYCEVCKKTFIRKEYLKNHIQVKHPYIINKSMQRQKQKCECGKTFVDKSNYNRHKKKYCPLVKNKLFKEKKESKKKESEKNIFFICDFCQKSYQVKSSLISHMIDLHRKALPGNTCEICDKTFSRRTSLKKHLITHTGVKSFSCDECQVKFKTKWGLTGHKKMDCTQFKMFETNDKNLFRYKCVCSREFNVIRGFKMHFKTSHKSEFDLLQKGLYK